jgi:hypothetical protein
MEIIAVCHVHSDWSYDGHWSLKDLAATFEERGARVLLMTEHDRGFSASRFAEYRAACAEASSSEIQVVPGIEYSDAANRVHVLVWGTDFLGENLPTVEMLNAVRARNGVAVLAHPSRKNVWQDVGPSWTGNLLGIEVWNRKYDGVAQSETAQNLLAASDCIPFVGLDFHTEKQLFPLTMVLDLPRVTEQEILNCLRSRRCTPHAFGIPFEHKWVRASMPGLRIAEQARKKIASAVKRSRAAKPKPNAK